MPHPSSAAITGRNAIADIYPLSPMQEGLLFHTVSSGTDGLYMPQTAIRLRGAVDGAALEAAWRGLIQRHGVLRTGFHWEERDEPFQVVVRDAPAAVTTLNWSAASDAEQRAKLSDLFAANRATTFDLRRPPLARAQWIETGPQDSILVVCYHHIILDGWSIRKLLEEFLLLYQRETGADTPPLPEAPPYSAYIGWLKRRDRATSASFWRSYLAGAPGSTRLLSGDATTRFQRYTWTCPPDLHRSMKACCTASGHTLNTLLQGALGLFIAWQTGADDIVFGTTTSGRPPTLAGATSMIGLFINTIPVRVAIDRAQPLDHWLADLQTRQATTMEHEHVPLSEIQGRGASLFDTLLVVENFTARDHAPQQPALTSEGLDFDERTHFPLTLWARPHADGLTLDIGYSADVISAATIADMASRLAALLAVMSSAPAETVGAILAQLPPASTALGFAVGRDRPAAHDPTRVATPPRRPLTTPTEALLATTWQDVLKCGALQSDANFFELGGHSLLAARVISRLRGALPVRLPVRALFEQPVLSELAAHIDGLVAQSGAGDDHIEVEL